MSDLMLTDAELIELEAMVAEAETRAAERKPAEFWRCYERLQEMLLLNYGITSADATYGSSVLWLDGATEANAGRGAFSDLIRAYTNEQYELRYGNELGDSLMQLASDNVARALFANLFGKAVDSIRGKVPVIGEIARDDARAVGDTLFGRDASDTASTVNSAWSGSLLFNMLRSDQTFRLCTTGNSTDEIDSLNDFRDVLYAASSYDEGLSAAGATFISEFPSLQFGTDVSIFGPTLATYMFFGGGELLDTLRFGAAFGPVGSALKTIGAVGEERILDMVMGAYQAKAMIGTTTEENYEDVARAFFGELSPAQLGASPIEISTGAKLAMEALTDKDALAALAALSVVKVHVASEVADGLTIYDELTGSGEYSQEWISQRGRMVSAFIRSEDSVRGTATAFRDVTSGVQLLVGDAALDQRIQIVFGSDGADALSGYGRGDAIFGMGANDTLSGFGGNDWLEGGMGDDALDGGDGMDVLVGAQDSDNLVGGSGLDRLDGGGGHDTYQFDGDWGTDEVVDLDGQGTLKIAGYESGLPVAAIKVTDGVWRSADGRVTFTRTESEASGYHLILSFEGKQGRIVLRDWESGWYGIELGSTAATGPGTARAYDGDQRALVIGKEVDMNVGPTDPKYHDYKWEVTSWQVDGSLTGGIPESGFSDAIEGSSLGDRINGLGGNDVLFGGDGDDWIEGGTGTDMLGGGKGKDWILAGDGNDYIVGGHFVFANRQVNLDDPKWQAPPGEVIEISGDTWGVTNLRAYAVDSDVPTDSASDFLDGGIGADTAIGGHGNDTVTGGGGDDELWGLGGSDVIVGGDDNDWILGDGYPLLAEAVQYCPELLDGADVLDGGRGNDFLAGGGSDDVLFGAEGNDELTGDAGFRQADWLTPARHGQDYLDGGGGDDILAGEGNDDMLIGGTGDDRLYGDMNDRNPVFVGNDLLNGGDGNDVLDGGGGDDRLDGGRDSDSLFGGKGNDTLIGGLGVDQFEGEEGDDVYVIGEEDMAPMAATAATRPPGRSGSQLPYACVVLPSGLATETAALDAALLPEGAESIYDPEGENTVQILGELRSVDADTDGSLTLALGAPGNGQRLFIYNAFFGQVETLDLGGNVVSLRDWVQENVTQAVVLTTEGAPIAYAFGAAGNDWFAGSSLNDTIDGGWGNDQMWGYDGQDSLIGSRGVDSLNGGRGDDFLSGGEDDDSLWADDGNDSIDGGEGDDVIGYAGGLGNDTYLFGYGDGQDVVERGSTSVSQSGKLKLRDGITAADLVITREWRSYLDDDGIQRSGYIDLRVTLSKTGDSFLVQDFCRGNDPYANGNPLTQIEFADGTLWDITGILNKASKGTELDDSIFGFDFLTETIEGYGGADELFGNNSDTLLGGDGDDTLDAGDHSSMDGGSGNDALWGGVQSSLNGGTGDDQLNAGALSSLVGDDGSDHLSGGLGSTIVGGAGDDHLEGYGDVTMFGNEGNDVLWVRSPGTAEAFASVYGGTGNDSITGSLYTRVHFERGDGNDTYVGLVNADGLATSSDRATLELGAGIASGDVTVALNGDALTLNLGAGESVVLSNYFWDADTTKRGLNAVISIGSLNFANGEARDVRSWIVGGTNGANTLTGTTGNDVIAGYLGNDNLSGGAGDDGLHGGAGDDTLLGSDGNDTLVGHIGVDSLVGGLGSDVYWIDDTDRAINEAPGAGIDEVHFSSVKYFPTTEYTLRANFENLTLEDIRDVFTAYGNELGNRIIGQRSDNILVGNDGNDSLFGLGGNDTLDGGTGFDSLDGGEGDDTLVGGAGDDFYWFDSAGDVAVEEAGGGVDTVSSSVSVARLDGEVENLVLTGADPTSGKGNSLNNAITGNSGANRLDGGGGVDSLAGGEGDDTYVIDTLTDVITELPGGGVDTLESSLTVSLAGYSGLENITLTGKAKLDATGDSAANALMGNAGANTLAGLAGDDRLDGRQGNDKLQGGDGADTYVFRQGDGLDTVTEKNATAGIRDRIEFVGLAHDQVSFVHVGNDLEASILGTTDKVIFKDWYLGSKYQVEDFAFTDGVWRNDQVAPALAPLIDAMAAFRHERMELLGGRSNWFNLRTGDLAAPIMLQ